MSVLVVDASVVIKWFLPEVHGEAARRLLAAPHQYLAPDLLFPEVGNVIWKKIRRGELTPRDGQRLAADLATVAVEAVASRVLLSDAVALAVATGLTVYDATYLALAVRLDTVLVTADERFGRAVAAAPTAAAHVRMVQTFES
ncbi:MAG: type II toxin-antitoxin system VapC family toxin [Vicinamibacterales bacterium]